MRHEKKKKVLLKSCSSTRGYSRLQPAQMWCRFWLEVNSQLAVCWSLGRFRGRERPCSTYQRGSYVWVMYVVERPRSEMNRAIFSYVWSIQTAAQLKTEKLWINSQKLRCTTGFSFAEGCWIYLFVGNLLISDRSEFCSPLHPPAAWCDAIN